MKKTDRCVKKLTREEHFKTRALYEEIFPEDDVKFVDYYYGKKTKGNQIYIVEKEEEMAAMLHLNPYILQMGKEKVQGQYIVAVATKAEYRHQGMMRSLLERSLGDMYDQKEPLAFLMPAAEAIYLPFDFRFIYKQNQCRISSADSSAVTDFNCRAAEVEDLEVLSECADKIVKEKYQTYAIHTREYFEELLSEQACQNGNVMVITHKGQICGYFFTSTEDVTEVREIMIIDQYKEHLLDILQEYLKKEAKVYGGMIEAMQAEYTSEPKIMARIIHLEAFLKSLTATEMIRFEIEIEDELIPQNAGRYIVSIDQQGGALKATTGACDWKLSIAELTELSFGMISIEESNAPKEVQSQWEKVKDLTPVMLNEIV